jgi:hypothetical protein
MNNAQLHQALQVAHSNFKAEAELRRQAEERLNKTVSEVVAMAYLLLGADLAEQLSQGGKSLRDLSPVQMVRLVKMRAYQKMTEAQTGAEVIVGVSPDEALSRGSARGVTRLELEMRMRELEAANQALQGEVTRLRQVSLTSVQTALPDPVESTSQNVGPAVQDKAEAVTVSVEPEMKKRARQLLDGGKLNGSVEENVQSLVRVLAEGTECRRRKIAQLLGVSGGTEQRMFNRSYALSEGNERGLGLVEATKVKAEISGKSTDLLRLTPLGLAVARLLTGRDPAEPLLDRLMARHRSPEHTFLNLEAADLLRAAGGTIDLFPKQVKLPNGGTLDVDLLWLANGIVLYVECERETLKNLSQRSRKWRNLRQVTSEFWIVTPDPSAQDALISEITQWSLGGRYSLELHLTNLVGATTEKPWLYNRSITWR